jgi:hypothetical protein
MLAEIKNKPLSFRTPKKKGLAGGLGLQLGLKLFDNANTMDLIKEKAANLRSIHESQ